MAAGIGRRYGGLKQIDPVGPSGEIVIDYSIHDALRAGFGKVVFVIREEIEEAFRETIGRNVEDRVETEYVFQRLDALPEGFEAPPGREKPWGTAHAVLCAAGAVTAPFAAINADDFYGRGAFESLSGYLSDARDDSGVYDFCMVGYVLENTLTDYGHVARGVCAVDNDGQLENIVERTKIKRFDGAVRFTEDDENWTDIDPRATVSMNMWGFTPGLMDELETRFRRFLEEFGNDPKKEFFLPTVVNELIEEGKARVKVLDCPERWYGVTYREDREPLTAMIAERVASGVYPEKLWS